MNRLVSSKHLEAVSDLTLSAPIRQGFIPAFESVTYETRLQLLLKALFKIRATAREHSKIKPFVDTAERIQSLLDFRLAVIDGEPRRLLLSATFDRPFEPYMRLIWDPLGPLLDVIFCNCEGYVTATGHSFEDYLAWVRKSQLDSDFFYSMGNHSVSDVKYLLEIEKLQRERHDESGTAVTAPDPEKEAAHVRRCKKKDSAFLGMEALVALYRLTDFYPPDDPAGDGELLRKAAQQLLRGWAKTMVGDDQKGWAEKLIPEQFAWFKAGNEETFSGKTDAEEDEEASLAEAEKIICNQRLKFKAKDIQGGIIEDYGSTPKSPKLELAANGERPIRHGALLLMRCHDAEKARTFIGQLQVTSGTDCSTCPDKDIFVNLALTWRGLVNLGVPEPELARFPQEFREGMEERAGLLGDLRAHHPRRWLPPLRNWPDRPSKDSSLRVDLSEVDLVLQLRTTIAVTGSVITDIHDDGHPLKQTVDDIAGMGKALGVELLAVETMRRAFHDDKASGTDHFGFMDGLSQPHPVDHRPKRECDEVSRGELLWGYVNDRSDPPPSPSLILDNGTFLVVRKLRQRTKALRELVQREAKKRHYDHEGNCFTVPEDVLYGKFVGRKQDGTVMLDYAVANKFDYQGDRTGIQCPFQAHVRRANPRAGREGETRRPTPRILRRGLSYGPPVEADQGEPEIDRGTIFMAYGASLAEQFEVIQRWINAGNSTGIGSWLRDPFMGVPLDDDKFKFRFRYKPMATDACQGGHGRLKPTTIRIELSNPFVELQWGTYLFVPSMAAIKAIARLSPVLQEQEQARLQKAEVRRGQQIIAKLQALAATGDEGLAAAAGGWKACIEDFRSKDPAERADGPAVWAAIRACHGGVLRVPYGEVGGGGTPPEVVLVASKELVMRVFRNADDNYSMCGQMARMKQSFGPIFLGLDRGDEYKAKAAIKGPIYEIPELIAFRVAYESATASLNTAFKLFADAHFPPDRPNDVGLWGEMDLRRDFITPALGIICNQWFGIPDTLPGDGSAGADDPIKDHCKPPANHVDFGGWNWEAARKPRCPGDFLATSRYCFYPDPVPRVQAYGKAHGQRLRKAVRAHFKEKTSPQAYIAALLTAQFKDDKDEIARTLIGVMTGFLPPTDATLRWTLYEWLEQKLFWRLQQDLIQAAPAPLSEEALNSAEQHAATLGLGGDPVPADILAVYRRAKAALEEPLKRAMQKRPSPDMLWRTSVKRHKLADVRVEDGDRIFIGIVSAMAEDAEAGVTDVYPVFGGRHDPKPDTAPLHACPAYAFAIGTMLGILGALMDRHKVEALPAPLLVRISKRPQTPS